MKTCPLLSAAFLLLSVVHCHGQIAPATAEKPRVLVLTDIANEPDDEESLVRFLVYSNEFEIEGLIATTSTWLKKGTREDLIRRQLAAYAQVRPNLLKHASGYPTAEDLAAVTKSGQPDYGMANVGPEKKTAGSQRIIEVIDRPDPRPVWVTVWGGANTLAQALSDLRATRSEADVKAAVAKLRVYAISDQDDAGAWLRKEFPGLFYIVSPSRPDGKEYWRATWTGISGDRWYKNGPMHKFALVENSWLEENVSKNHGPLGALYPRWKYIMEGDTPCFLGLVPNGLRWEVSPAFGGWGGRYVSYQATGETRKIWTNNADSRDTVTADNGKVETSDPATIWRWREHFQHDFAARMDWCVADAFEKANHNPQPALNGDRSKNIVTLQAKAGSEITLSAEGTGDPDGNNVNVKWWIYSEAGTTREATLTSAEGLATTLKLPATAKAGTVHVILQAEDDGVPRLFAYRRIVVEVSR
ncbi:MAG TPA: DUF1593 domain-containing protein [Opitutaceae bacterium]|nr:DUF1593 domain-containing protein [Opitutaceae bacterium]